MADYFIILIDTASHATNLTSNTLERLSVASLVMTDFRLHVVDNRYLTQGCFEISGCTEHDLPFIRLTYQPHLALAKASTLKQSSVNFAVLFDYYKNFP